LTAATGSNPDDPSSGSTKSIDIGQCTLTLNEEYKSALFLQRGGIDEYATSENSQRDATMVAELETSKL
jgi:hypothetical protein